MSLKLFLFRELNAMKTGNILSTRISRKTSFVIPSVEPENTNSLWTILLWKEIRLSRCIHFPRIKQMFLEAPVDRDGFTGGSCGKAFDLEAEGWRLMSRQYHY